MSTNSIARPISFFAAAAALIVLAGCGGGGGGGATASSFTVGGTIIGLSGAGLVLQNNGGDDLAIAGNGGFAFPARLNSGSAYDVTVKTAPADPRVRSTMQACDVTNGSGTINGADVTNIVVACTTLRFFPAADGVNDHEPWKTDGTAAGTVRVKDINPGAGGSDPSGFTAFNGAIYFRADDGTNGAEVWKTDGTEAGTVLVKNINTATDDVFMGSSNPTGFTVFDGALYFAATDATNGRELWKTDGTEAGTVQVKDINAEAGNALQFPSGFTVFDGALYFMADDETNGFEVWKTDGTDAGTVRVTDIDPGPRIPFRTSSRFSTARSIFGPTTACALPSCGKPTAPQPVR